ncbi:Glycosyl transferase, group 2 family protein [hydrothermal vent metagenome]|uniref:Glycosyl transferase, group 2 family protein n=1 Tax=hydrothermal vent metagenome TaxID=652676 RepID=A0A3B0T1Y1_9ZZZZ
MLEGQGSAIRASHQPSQAGSERRAAQAPTSFERFLVETGEMPPQLLSAFRLAMRHSAASAVEIAAAEGIIDEEALYGALARYRGLPFLPRGETGLQVEIDANEVESCLRHQWLRLRDRRGSTFVIAAPRDPAARALRHLGVTGAGGQRVIDTIAAPSTIRALIDGAFSASFTENAIWGLARATPEFSAHRRLVPWQGIALGAIAAGFALGVWAAPLATFFVAGLGLAGVFFMVSVFRLSCFVAAFAGRRPLPKAPGGNSPEDRSLPVYTVLVPLYREAGMVHQTVAALLALDYPRARLDIKLVLEADDTETLGAVERLDLPGCIEVVVVPPSLPRTKPKAMNYALARARGDLVAVFDAEDIPQPTQLRTAARAFRSAPEKLACFQCRLGFYNTGQNWLTRQFAIEYAALFEVILPVLDRLGLPLMLGGTSNHFRTFALRDAGGWDAFNVTEDADLGLRLARLGYKSGWLDSLTLEEATSSPRTWLAQRQRWLRGWMQTYAVHMRNPGRLLGELGVVGFLSFQAIVGGVVLSAMVYPLFLAHFLWLSGIGEFLLPSGEPVFDGLLLVNAVNLLFGFGVTVELAIFGLYRSGQARLLWQIPLLPVYWLYVSLASYLALWRLCRRPFEWEKTYHRPRRPLS